MLCTEILKKKNNLRRLLKTKLLCQDVTCSNMQAVWKYLLPHCINDVLGFNSMEKIIAEISVIESNIGFEMAIENV